MARTIDDDGVLVLVCGSRTFQDRNRCIWHRLNELTREYPHLKASQITILTGGAPGVDTWARALARSLGYQTEVMPAQWERPDGTIDRGAGYKRNSAMLDRNPALVLAFHDGSSRGTAHTIREARKRGLPLEVIVRS